MVILSAAKMGWKIDTLANYPKTNRNVEDRGETEKEEDRAIACKFGKEFSDGDRKHGYGGFTYNSKFWQPVIPAFQEHFGLAASVTVLDVECAKGFMMHDMVELIPGITVKGSDISEYPIENAIEDMKIPCSSGQHQEPAF